MDQSTFKSIQAPLKAMYKDQPDKAVITLRAEGSIGEGVTCSVETGRALVKAGLHAATGGDGLSLCSGDLLLQALVACAGVTLNAVSTSLGIELQQGIISAEGEIDFRGTLGVSKDAPVGFRNITLYFNLQTNASQEQIDALIKLTERYCVVLQTIRHTPEVKVVQRRIND